MRIRLLWVVLALVLAGEAPAAVPSNPSSEGKAKAEQDAMQARVKKEAADKEKARKAAETKDSAERKKSFDKSGQSRPYRPKRH